jgi:hypothetical protein
LESFSWFLSLFLVLLLSLVLRLWSLLFRGVLPLVLSWSRLLAVFRLSVVSVALSLWLCVVVRCGLRWLLLARLVCLWCLAFVRAGVVLLPLVRSGSMLLVSFLWLSLLLLLVWLLRGVCLCLPKCFSSLLLLGWACFFFQQPTKGANMIEVGEMNEWCDDAVTHGLYVSEVEEKYRGYYAGYLSMIKREDLIDINIGKE